jgi:hypothetical protein
MGIVRRAKFPPTAPIIRYRDARAAIAGYLASPTRDLNPLNAARAVLTLRLQDTASTALARDDAQHSLEALDAIVRMRNQVAPFDFHLAPQKQNKLTLSGVEVSVRADLIVHGSARSVDQFGAAVFRLTVDDAQTEAALTRRREIGTYVATLARMHVDANFASDREPANRLCMSIDVQHGEVFVAPNATARRMNDLTNACAFIAAVWPGITP